MRRAALPTALALCLLAAGLPAQEPKEDPARPRFKRDQGTAEELKDRLGQLLQALGASQNDKARELLTSFAPDEKSVEDALTPEAWKALGPKLLEGSKALFSGDPQEVAARLKLDPTCSEVTVWAASTEDLLSMEPETDAARHFAGGLRRAAQNLKPRYRFYAAVMRKPDSPETEAGIRLQIFVHFQGRYVLLGKVWRLEE